MIQQIVDDLWRIEVPLPGNPLKSINSYFIRGSSRNLLVDTGLNRQECFEAIWSGLRQLDADLARTDFFITHMHADHSGLVARLATETSRVYFNRPDAEILRNTDHWETMLRRGAQNGFPKETLHAALRSHPGFRHGSHAFPELTLLEEGDDLCVGTYRFRCVATPGHTRGHTCLYEPLRRLLLSGDHLLVDITPNIQCWSEDGNPLKEYLASLDKVRSLKVDLVLPGHRKLFRNHRERIDELKGHHQRRAEEVLAILDRGWMTAFEVASRMSWDIDCDGWENFPPAQKWFATGEALAHLRYLEEKGRVLRTDEPETGTTLFSSLSPGQTNPIC